MAHTRQANTPQRQSWSVARTIEALRAYGINYLIAGEHADEPPVVERRHVRPPIGELVRALACSDDPRVRHAMVSLLLANPGIADDVVALAAKARARGEQNLAEQIITLSLAAVYLQRIWRFQLAFADAHTSLPQLAETPFAAWWSERGLPAPAVEYGEGGLRRLADYERERTGTIARVEDDWLNQVEHLIAQRWTRARHAANSLAQLRSPAWRSLRQSLYAERDQGDDSMSFRADVSRDDIERFLQQFGQLSQQAGRLYLAGGAELVHSGIRGDAATTVDIDVRIDVGDVSGAETLIRQLMHQLGINVEFASPADFIPLPTDWQTRSPFVGRYGAVDVFYFDYYALALSKIARGTSRDLHDLVLLAQNGLIQRDELEEAYQQIAPQLGHGRFFNIDPAKFAQQYAATLTLLP